MAARQCGAEPRSKDLSLQARDGNFAEYPRTRPTKAKTPSRKDREGALLKLRARLRGGLHVLGEGRLDGLDAVGRDLLDQRGEFLRLRVQRREGRLRVLALK